MSGLFGAILAGEAWLSLLAGQATRDAWQLRPKRKSRFIAKAAASLSSGLAAGRGAALGVLSARG